MSRPVLSFAIVRKGKEVRFVKHRNGIPLPEAEQDERRFETWQEARNAGLTWEAEVNVDPWDDPAGT